MAVYVAGVCLRCFLFTFCRLACDSLYSCNNVLSPEVMERLTSVTQVCSLPDLASLQRRPCLLHTVALLDYMWLKTEAELLLAMYPSKPTEVVQVNQHPPAIQSRPV